MAKVISGGGLHMHPESILIATGVTEWPVKYPGELTSTDMGAEGNHGYPVGLPGLIPVWA